MVVAIVYFSVLKESHIVATFMLPFCLYSIIYVTFLRPLDAVSSQAQTTK